MNEPTSISPTDRYYIQDTRQFCGNAMLFWCPKGAGYTAHLENAGIYSLSEARIKTERGTARLIPVETIDGAATLQVDIQRLEKLLEKRAV